jgi:hypothetical protein
MGAEKELLFHYYTRIEFCAIGTFVAAKTGDALDCAKKWLMHSRTILL